MPKSLAVAMTIVLVASNFCRADDEEPIDFAHDIVPMLRKHCADCHSGKEAEGGFSFNCWWNRTT